MQKGQDVKRKKVTRSEIMIDLSGKSALFPALIKVN
jgi:hypothetical protein